MKNRGVFNKNLLIYSLLVFSVLFILGVYITGNNIFIDWIFGEQTVDENDYSDLEGSGETGGESFTGGQQNPSTAPATTVALNILTPTPLAGWPIKIPKPNAGGATVAVYDLDSDGKKEVIAYPAVSLSGARLTDIYVYDSGGMILPGWPQSIKSYGGISIAVGNLASSKTNILNAILITTENELYVFDIYGKILNGWPVGITGKYPVSSASATIADIDLDGVNEIIYHGSKGLMYVLGPDGKSKNPFPLSTNSLYTYTKEAVADIDLDGKKEIVSIYYVQSGQYILDSVLNVFDTNGKSLNGWPKVLNSVDMRNFIYPLNIAPAIGNIDNDPQLEVIVQDKSNGNLYSFNYDGSKPSLNWPMIFSTNALFSQITVANIDNDPQDEIVFSTPSSWLNVIKGDRTYVSGWPVKVSGGGIVTVGDIDGDGVVEVLATNGFYDSNKKVWVASLLAFHNDGTLVNGFPLYGNPSTTSFNNAAPIITDLDVNGEVDIVLGGNDETIYAWTMKGAKYNPGSMEWPTAYQNSQITGSKY